MERLTYDFCVGNKHCWQVKGADNLECREVCRNQGEKGCTDCPIAKAFDRLAAYEETGLDPEELEEKQNEAYDLGYQSCLNYKGLRWDEAEELQRYREIGSIDRLRELAQAEKTGQLAEFPFIAMVEQSLRDGTMKPMSDQKHNGRYAVVYKSERWTFPLIDICGTPYNTEQAVERMREISREAAEAALKEREAEHDR